MFFLTLALGALFLVIIHHLTDAGWSVATRRFCEHLASLLVSVAGDFIFASRNFCETHLSVDVA